MDLSSYSLILFIVLCGFCGLNFAYNVELPDNLDEDLDITYPGCGFRSPKEFERSNSPGNGSSDTNKNEDKCIVDERIVGGEEASENSWPWMVFLHGPEIMCGASLISKQYVLTAAHCLEKDNDPSQYTLVVGSHDLQDGTEYGIQKILMHPDYVHISSGYDIALLEIDSTVELSQTVYPVCLPSHGLKALSGTEISDATVTGWGFTDYGECSNYLLEVTVPLLPLEKCDAAYGGMNELFICAGGTGKDSCDGDSGGPLVARLEDDSYVQLGIVSFGSKDCGHPDYPGVYTNVMQFVEWLYDNTDLGK